MKTKFLHDYNTNPEIPVITFKEKLLYALENPFAVFDFLNNRFKLIYYKIKYGKRFSFGKNFIVLGKFKVFITEGDGRIEIGDNVTVKTTFENNYLYSKHGGIIKIGNGCFLNGAKIYSFKEIEIGKNVLIGWNSEILDTDLHPISYKEGLKNEKVTVKDHSWIGSNASILKGVTINEGAVIGANAVVVKDVEAHSVVCGNPAKFIKKIGKR